MRPDAGLVAAGLLDGPIQWVRREYRTSATTAKTTPKVSRLTTLFPNARSTTRSARNARTTAGHRTLPNIRGTSLAREGRRAGLNLVAALRVNRTLRADARLGDRSDALSRPASASRCAAPRARLRTLLCARDPQALPMTSRAWAGSLRAVGFRVRCRPRGK